MTAIDTTRTAIPRGGDLQRGPRRSAGRNRPTPGHLRGVPPGHAWLMEAGEMGYEIPLLLDVFLGTTVDNVNFGASGARRAMWRGRSTSRTRRAWSCPTYCPVGRTNPRDAVVLRDRAVDRRSALARAMLDVWQANGAGGVLPLRPGRARVQPARPTEPRQRGPLPVRDRGPLGLPDPHQGPTGQLVRRARPSRQAASHVPFKISHPDAARHHAVTSTVTLERPGHRGCGQGTAGDHELIPKSR